VQERRIVPDYHVADAVSHAVAVLLERGAPLARHFTFQNHGYRVKRVTGATFLAGTF